MTPAASNPKQREGPGAPPVHCRFCGACCADVGDPPFRAEEMASLHAELRYIVEWFGRRDPRRSGDVIPCYFLNLATRKCLIYEHRPQACRDFRAGSHLCKEHRRAFVPCLSRFVKDMASRH